jgi:hypothetical protein
MFAAAWVELKKDLVFVYAQSGGRGAAADHDAFSTHMRFPPEEGELGAAVRQALSASRHLDPAKMDINDIRAFMHGEAQERHKAYLKRAMQLTGVKSEAAFYRGSKACSIRRMDDRFKLTPTLDGKGSWGKHQATQADLRYFPVGASDEEIQAAVLESLSLSK